MTIRQSLFWATEKLNQSKIKSAALDAEILLSHTLNKPKSFLYSRPEHKPTKSQLQKFKHLISRRSKHEPVAYIIHHKEFYGLDFYVNKNVLIPRPETEILVEQVLKNKKIKTVIDIGTGSGCISVSLAKYNPKLKITASDISPKALSIAQKNAQLYKVNGRIKFIKSDLLKKIPNSLLLTPGSCIVANLPYLSEKIYRQQYSNLKFEPKSVLYAGKDGLKYYKKLFEQIKQLQHVPKFIYLEINPDQVQKLEKITRLLYPSAKTCSIKDYAGKKRIFMLYLPMNKTKKKGGESSGSTQKNRSANN